MDISIYSNTSDNWVYFAEMVSMFRDKVVINDKVDNRERESCRQQYARWDKPIAGIVGVLTFMAIVGCLIYDIYQPIGTAKGIETNSSRKNKNGEDYCTLPEEECEVLCAGVPATVDIERSIASVISDCEQIKFLHIQNSTLIGNKLPSNWLQNLGKSVLRLRFTNVPIATIEDGTFSTSTFKQTTDLVLAATKITYLEKNALLSLPVLNYFSLEYYVPAVCSFEYGFLQHIGKTIQTLQVTMCLLTSETIRNLTNSDVALGNLQKIDFSYSIADSLEGYLFNQAYNIKSIYLHGMTLTHVDVNLFRGLRSLRLVHLNDNGLVSMEDGIFSDMVKGPDTHIHIHKNRWRCDCDLEWLQVMYIEEEYISTDPTEPTCYFENWPEKKDVPFEKVEFCVHTTETSTITILTTQSSSTNTTDVISTTSEISANLSTSTPSQNTTQTSTSTIGTNTTDITPTTLPPTMTTPSGKYRILTCRDWKRSPIILSDAFTKELVYTQDLIIHEETVRFDFYEINDVPVHIGVEIDTKSDICSYHLLWFNSKNTSDTGCISNLDDSIIIDEMKRNNTYTICIMYGGDTTVTPYDCLGLRVRVEYKERAWIRNKSKTTIIAVAMSLVVLAILLSMLMMYLCVRFHPHMIKGNKRVVIIGKASREPSVRPPEEYERPAYFTPSIASYITSQSSYLPPANGYSRIKERYRNYALGNVREESLYNGEVTYVRPKVPSADQLSSWRIQNLRDRFSNETLGHSNNIYEQPNPPPLPPPNQKKVTIEENLYTCV